MADTQRINGFVPSWGDIYVKVDSERYYGIGEIAYGDTRVRSKLYGMARHHAPRGRTSGKYEVDEATMKMDLLAAGALREALASKAADGKSYGSVIFEVVVQYEDSQGNVRTDTLAECCITKMAVSHSEGPDALMEDVSMDVMSIDRDGLTLYDKTEVAP